MHMCTTNGGFHPLSAQLNVKHRALSVQLQIEKKISTLNREEQAYE